MEYEAFISEITDVAKDEETRRELFHAIDVNHDHVIKFNELVAVFLDERKIMDTKMLSYLFGLVDKDGDNCISQAELEEFMSNNNVTYTNMDIIDVFNKIDKNGDKMITIDEFNEGMKEYLEET
mmetsp:Transcript_99660/g.215047  ORF Transcript_99660/g.215047 Transcript_99660/m.215047 type:complete len:124 (+) Transcript_99660:293-664(+)|eukprot:CAMPEP_0116926674 /NCGR_PEP_ID=MMETSP0467-20121206/24869_1 /TAXON_ID=283647 /ORGANISM="Mesodinium pulex, Strain SPMC105" /LENGTH=123 /DNA_ID=CAMNT_0004605983 /DNA_START=1696 /DNA_END=2067 /DNA_ORIENTATION=-